MSNKMSYKKYTLLNIAILTLGIAVGMISILGYQFFSAAQDDADRDEAIDFLYETSLLINENQALQEELVQLQNEVLTSKTSYQIAQNTQINIERLRSVLGKDAVKGPGIVITIDKEIPYYAFIDITNDLFTIGAEAISVNDIRIHNNASFTENTVTNQVFLSLIPLSPPYEIKVIGDSKTILSKLSRDGNFLERISRLYNMKEDITIIGETTLEILAWKEEG